MLSNDQRISLLYAGATVVLLGFIPFASKRMLPFDCAAAICGAVRATGYMLADRIGKATSQLSNAAAAELVNQPPKSETKPLLHSTHRTP